MPKPTFSVVTGADLRARLAAERGVADYLVDGLIRSVGVTLVVGAAFGGKTTLLCGASTAVAAGADFAGRGTVKGTVVWVYQDRDPKPFLDTLASAEAAVGAEGCALVLTPPSWTLDSESDVAELVKILDEVDASLLVIDCLRRVTTANENDSGDIADLQSQLRKLAAGKRAVVVIHHASRSGEPRGSSDFSAGAESVLAVQTSGDVINVKARHHAGPATNLRLRRIISDTRMAFEAVDGGAQRDDVTAAILAHLSGVKGSSRQDLDTGIRSGGIRARAEKIGAALARLVTEGAVREAKRGRAKWYSLVARRTSSDDVGRSGGDEGASTEERSDTAGASLPGSQAAPPTSSPPPYGGESGADEVERRGDVAGRGRTTSGEIEQSESAGQRKHAVVENSPPSELDRLRERGLELATAIDDEFHRELPAPVSETYWKIYEDLLDRGKTHEEACRASWGDVWAHVMRSEDRDTQAALWAACQVEAAPLD